MRFISPIRWDNNSAECVAIAGGGSGTEDCMWVLCGSDTPRQSTGYLPLQNAWQHIVGAFTSDYSLVHRSYFGALRWSCNVSRQHTAMAKSVYCAIHVSSLSAESPNRPQILCRCGWKGSTHEDGPSWPACRVAHGIPDVAEMDVCWNNRECWKFDGNIHPGGSTCFQWRAVRKRMMYEYS